MIYIHIIYTQFFILFYFLSLPISYWLFPVGPRQNSPKNSPLNNPKIPSDVDRRLLGTAHRGPRRDGSQKLQNKQKAKREQYMPKRGR